MKFLQKNQYQILLHPTLKTMTSMYFNARLRTGFQAVASYFLTGFFSASMAFADVSLPAVFSDNMVLQRDMPIKIWGQADRRETVSITFLGETVTVKPDKKGNWRAELKAAEAGGPHEMTVKGNNEILLNNILVGDVWICSGQSNMEWPLSAAENGEKEAGNAINPRIRLLTVQKNTSTIPVREAHSDGWLVCAPETVASFSAVGYFFGKKLNADLDVPIGLINTSWGGTNVETWTSAKAIEKVEGFEGIAEEVLKFDQEKLQKELRERLEAIHGPIPDEDIGMDGDVPLWADSNTDYSDWESMDIPTLWENAGLQALDGIVWFAKEFYLDLPDLQSDAEIHLGPIDDSDISYLNGVEIGRTIQKYNEDRIYKIKKPVLKQGRNILVVRVEDTGGGGGIYGNPEQMFVSLPGKKISMAGAWKYKIGKGDFSTGINPNSMPSLLYNAMIFPLIPYGIKGAIWYQGESNAGRAYEYRTLFPVMINNWRNDWGQGDFPFLFVQLANYMEPQEQPGESAWAELREAQTMTLSLPKTGMATIIDIGEAGDIHPRNKHDVGKRLAISALKVAYDKEIVPSGPVFKEMKIEGSKVILSFDNVASGFFIKNKYAYINGFAIAGEDKQFYWSKAEIDGDKIVLQCEKVKQPIAVRYGWADNPDDLNLYNMDGLPAVPFRTDSWPGITVNKTYR